MQKKNPSSKKLKFTLSGIQPNITRHANRQENVTHTEEKHQSELTQILDINKDIKQIWVYSLGSKVK